MEFLATWIADLLIGRSSDYAPRLARHAQDANMYNRHYSEERLAVQRLSGS